MATAAGNLATGAERADVGHGAVVTILARGLETAHGVAGSLASGKLYVGKTLVTGEALKLMLSGMASMTGAPILKMLNGVTAWKSAATDVLNKGWATAEIKATTPIAERLAIAALSRGKEEAVAGGRSVLGIAPGQAGDVGRWASRAFIPLGVASGIVNLGTDGPELLKQPSVDNFLGSLSGASGLVGSGAAVSSAIPLWGEGPSEVIAAGGYTVSAAADLLKTGYDLFKSSPPPAPLTLAQRLAATEAGQPYSTWAANGPLGTTPWALAHPFVQR